MPSLLLVLLVVGEENGRRGNEYVSLLDPMWMALGYPSMLKIIMEFFFVKIYNVFDAKR